MVLRGRVLRTEDAGTGYRTDTICVDVVADKSLAENFRKPHRTSQCCFSNNTLLGNYPRGSRGSWTVIPFAQSNINKDESLNWHY